MCEIFCSHEAGEALDWVRKAGQARHRKGQRENRGSDAAVRMATRVVAMAPARSANSDLGYPGGNAPAPIVAGVHKDHSSRGI
jgi:hypothetical protein